MTTPTPSATPAPTDVPTGTATTTQTTVATGAPTVEPTYTQADLNAIGAREKGLGDRDGRRAVLESLGLNPDQFDAAAVRAALDAARAAETANLSDSERAKREAEADRQAAATAKAEAAADRLDARKERLLTAAGVAPGAMFVALGGLPLTAEDDDTAAQGKVEALKQAAPGLFGASTTTGTPLAPSGGPTGTPPRPTPTGDAFTRGQERAKRLAGNAGT